MIAGTLSEPQVDSYNVRVGTETFAALYKFTTNTALVETAQAITNMGSDVIKFYCGNNASGQEGVSLTSNITNLLTLVRDQPSYHQVLDMPFRHFVMWAYAFGNSDEWWGSGYNATQGAIDYQEMYGLTRYLLTNYNNSGKTFYLGHWEGDGYLEVNNWTTNPRPATIQGMIGWLNNRQQAVDDAKAATTYSNVFVYNYAEANRVRDAMLNGTNNNQRVINCVVPYVTNLDYLSYSSYDSQNLSQSDLYTTLNYMQSMLPTNKASVVPGERIWIGEYGWGYLSTAAQEPLDRAYIQRLLGWSNNGQCLPFILFWEMYSNYNPNGATNFCLIDYTGAKVPSWYLQNYFYNYARLDIAQFNETNNRLPSDTEFTAMVSPLLNQPLSAPVALTLANAGAMVLSNTTATLSGSLAQGIYGDNQAAVYVYYGLQDGGTNFSNWQNARFLGINTNFNPRTFSVTVNNLMPNTNYYFRFYASNGNTNVWAPSSAPFSTVILGPSNYGSGMTITFSGYSQTAPLVNFPVLVSLSTNLPGFSYAQFASPTGSDLRFTDASGLMVLPYEMDEWNTNGVSTVWVIVPSIATTNDFIQAYWGNPVPDVPAPPASNVWLNAGYQLVYHLKETGFPYADSTGSFPATKGVATTQTTGVIGHGQNFNGSAYLSPGAVTLSNSFTASAWINLGSGDSNIQTLWANQVGGYGANGFSWFVDSYNTADRIMHADSGNGAGGGADPTGSTTVTNSQWHYVAAAYSQPNSSVSMYLDGKLIGTGSAVSNFGLTNNLYLGAFLNPTYQFKGQIDEARIQCGIASSNWVSASYQSVVSNATLQTYSTVNRQSPDLTYGGSNNPTLLTWPASGVGFGLYTTTNLTPPVAWTLATNQVLFTNNQWQASIPPGSDMARFYRLQAQ